MGIFSKKKPSSSVSSLSENEIQKRLYGEFYTGNAQVVTGEREVLQEPAASPAPQNETFTVKREEIDLFTLQKEATGRTEVPFRSPSSAPKPDEAVARQIASSGFERKPAVPVSAGTHFGDRQRTPQHQYSGGRFSGAQGLAKGLSGRVLEMIAFLRDPKQAVLRRFLYWGLAALVVFILFWGVNVLNSQRETAMRVRYRMASETPAPPAPVSTAPAPAPNFAPPSTPGEREVVITPAPVKKISKPAVAAAAPVENPVVVSKTSYVIQVVTYPAMQDAEKIVSALKKEGLRAFVKESARVNGGSYYLVLIGGFNTMAEAQAQLLKFRSKEVARPFPDAFVKASRS